MSKLSHGVFRAVLTAPKIAFYNFMLFLQIKPELMCRADAQKLRLHTSLINVEAYNSGQVLWQGLTVMIEMVGKDTVFQEAR